MRLFATAIALAALVAMANPANAALVLTIDDLSTPGIDVIVVDNSAVGTATSKGLSTHADAMGVAGAVVYSGSVGAFSVAVTTGISKPHAPNSDTLAMTDIANISVSGGAGRLRIMLTDTNFVLNISKVGTWGGMDLSIGGTLSSALNSLSAQGWIDLGNGEFVMTGHTILSDTFTGKGGFSGNYRNGPVLLTNPFSLTQQIDLVHGAAGTSSFDSQLTVPEPASALLLALGFAGVAVRRRRKQA